MLDSGLVLSILVLGVVVERATELLHAAKIFLPLRNWIALKAYPPGVAPLGSLRLWARIQPWSVHPDLEHAPEYGRRLAHFADTALGCGYCTSVWVAMVFAFICPLPFTAPQLLGWVIRVVLLHGMANLYHVLYERQRKWATHPTPIHLMVDLRHNDDEIS